MASTNSDSVQWVVGDTVGRDTAGNTVALPGAFAISTSTTAPTASPDGLPFYLAGTDLYIWDASAWVGPYSVAT